MYSEKFKKRIKEIDNLAKEKKIIPEEKAILQIKAIFEEYKNDLKYYNGRKFKK